MNNVVDRDTKTVQTIALSDYYSQRTLNPDGRNLLLYQYNYEYDMICVDGQVYALAIRYIGDGTVFVHISRDGVSWSDYFDGAYDVEKVHVEAIFHLQEFMALANAG